MSTSLNQTPAQLCTVSSDTTDSQRPQPRALQPISTTMYNNTRSTTININDQESLNTASSEATQVLFDERFKINSSHPEEMVNVPSTSTSSSSSSISDQTKNEDEQEDDRIEHRHPPRVRRSIYTRFFRLDQEQTRSSVIVKSSWLPTGGLFFIRFVMFIYALVVLIADMCLTDRIRYEFCYLTQLSYTGLIAYLGTTSWHTFSEWRRNRAIQAISDDKEMMTTTATRNPSSLTEITLVTRKTSIERQYWLLTDMIFFLYHTVCTFHVIVPIVYWGYLAYAGDAQHMALGIPQDARWRNYSFHGGDLVLVLIDFSVNTMPFIPSHIIIVFIVCLLYLGEAFVVYHVDGFWLYPFLDTSVGPIWMAYYVAVGVAIALAFFLMYFFHWLRNKQIAKSILKKQQRQIQQQQEEEQQQSSLSATHQQSQDQGLENHGHDDFDISQSTIEMVSDTDEMNELKNYSMGERKETAVVFDAGYSDKGSSFHPQHRFRSCSVSSNLSTTSTLVGPEECKSKTQEKDRPLSRRTSKRSSSRSDVPPTILEIEILDSHELEQEHDQVNRDGQSTNSERLEVVHEGNEIEFDHPDNLRTD